MIVNQTTNEVNSVQLETVNPIKSSVNLEEVITYYSNGSIESRSMRLNGRIHGKYEAWYENGQKWSKSTYVNGKRQFGG